jgi:hypothetical protein
MNSFVKDFVVTKKFNALCTSPLILLFLSYPCFAVVGSSWSPGRSVDDSSASSTYRVNPSREAQAVDTSPVSPFAPGSHNLALDLGQVFLMGDLSQYSNSIGTQIHYTYGVSDLFAFDSSFGFSQHSASQFSMASLLTGLRTNLSWFDKVVPYFVVGLGFYRPSYQNPVASNGVASIAPGLDNSVSALLFGLHLGPGIDLELSRSVFFGASFTLNTMFGTTQTLASGATFNVGGVYSSFFTHIGVTF